MTNGDWIRGMTDEELARHVINPCIHYECGECPWKNARGKCVFNAGVRGKCAADNMAMEWIESGHEDGR